MTAKRKALLVLDALSALLWRGCERAVRVAYIPVRVLLGMLFKSWRVSPSADSGAVSSHHDAMAALEGLEGIAGKLHKMIENSMTAKRLLLFSIMVFVLLAWGGRGGGSGRSSGGGGVLASYYEHGFVGMPTASGEMYMPWAMTAAHRTIPFGTYVRVRSRIDGSEVIVRINDRGPFIDGRSIDLSKGAAARLGILDKGLVPVELEIFGR